MRKNDDNQPLTRGMFRGEFKKEFPEAFRKASSNIVSKLADVDMRLQLIEQNMYTKQDHQVHMIYMDEAMTELRDMREERILRERQRLRMDDKLDNHEKRICVLERGK